MTGPNGMKEGYGFRPKGLPYNSHMDFKGAVLGDDDSNYEGYAEHSWKITKMQHDEIVNLANKYNNMPWNLMKNNCVDFVLGAAKIAGVNISRADVQSPVGASDPTLLKQKLETLNGDR